MTVDSNDDSLSDADISTTKLPLYKEFDSERHDWRWYAQGALTYMTYEESLYVPRPDGGRESLPPEWKGALYDWDTLASIVRAHWPAAQRLGTQLVLKLVVNCHQA